MADKKQAAALRSLAALTKKKATAQKAAQLLSTATDDSDIIGMADARTLTRRSVARIRRAIHAGFLPGHAHGVSQPVSRVEFTSRSQAEEWTLAGAPDGVAPEDASALEYISRMRAKREYIPSPHGNRSTL